MPLIYLFCLVCLFLNLLFFFQTNSFQVQDVTDKQNVISIARAFPILIGQYVTTAKQLLTHTCTQGKFSPATGGRGVKHRFISGAGISTCFQL